MSNRSFVNIDTTMSKASIGEKEKKDKIRKEVET